VTARRLFRKDQLAAAVPRVGLFGLLGAGNIGNDASAEVVLDYLRKEHPETIVDAMCTGPEKLADEFGITAIALDWRHKYAIRTAGGRARQGTAAGSRGLPDLRAIAMIALGKGIDAIRTAAWVRRHDAVIVAGAGVLETSVPLRPWETPYAMFLLCASGRIFGTKVALVSVGATDTPQPLTRWLLNQAARLAYYRSYRDDNSRDVMCRRGIDVVADHVYPDLVMGLAVAPSTSGDPLTVGVGVMTYYGTNDDRQRAQQIHATYVHSMKSFVRWLVDNGRKVRLLVGDDCDDAMVQTILHDMRAYRPDLEADWVSAKSVLSFRDLTEAIAPVGYVVATRFHNVMCALKLGKPTISLGYSSKNEALMASMDMAEFSQSASSLDVDRLIEQFIELEHRSVQIRQTLAERVQSPERMLEGQFTELSDVLFRPSENHAAVRSSIS
jgi:polysaccharide pyruvyl transferase WcaK-like protein